MDRLQGQPVWLALAVASGACAAFNGVFAKLTTTTLTSRWSTSFSSMLSLSPTNQVVEYLLRAFFFGLNLLFNVVMWSLFTAALTRAVSTTRVSIINVSSNFVVTAVLGWVIFGEDLPPLWWVGAALLAVGNVVIGARKDEEKEKEKAKGVPVAEDRVAGDGGLSGGMPLMQDEFDQEDADMIDLDGNLMEDDNSVNTGPLKEGEDVDRPLIS